MIKKSFFLVLGLSLTACSGMGTTVDEDDPESELPNLSMGRSIMEGLGAVPSRRLPINYTPRAPLVVPKETDRLAAPEDPKQLTAQPNWPQDPDVLTRERLKEADARQRRRGDKSTLVPSSELLAERTPPSGNLRGDDELNSKPLKSSELMRGPTSLSPNAGLYDENGRPIRRALVEPPVTYLEPAPGAPVGIPEETPGRKKRGLFSWLPW